ncbi:hypothetical protein BOTBODRAFT_41514 [Botryobasidium botryosum FD-172 SS1]|uniref:NYN domain-containing protein n=1 Tax=Botryobasidium botryosum (strain FD-172 SS1) TaxID=930990 RepID=A0A067N4Z3_BOTB1|nr:hypothetical protein BOTBODRAFT_41514 [Botryobasidium botryosum FD-172 SS1]
MSAPASTSSTSAPRPVDREGRSAVSRKPMPTPRHNMDASDALAEQPVGENLKPADGDSDARILTEQGSHEADLPEHGGEQSSVVALAAQAVAPVHLTARAARRQPEDVFTARDVDRSVLDLIPSDGQYDSADVRLVEAVVRMHHPLNLSPEYDIHTLCAFIDYSNIERGFRQYWTSKGIAEYGAPHLLSLRALHALIARGRPLRRRGGHLATSDLPAAKWASEGMAQLGYELHTPESTQHANGERQEQGVDEELQWRIYSNASRLFDDDDDDDDEGDARRLGVTFVVATGDGADAEHNLGGFPDALSAAMILGISVELWTWRKKTSSDLVKLAHDFPTKFRLFELDRFAPHLLPRVPSPEPATEMGASAAA